MNFAITLFVLGVLVQVRLNAAAPNPYGGTRPAGRPAVSSEPIIKPDTTQVDTSPPNPPITVPCGCKDCKCTIDNHCGCKAQPPPKAACGCTDCKCTEDNHCGCKAKLPPPPPKSACGCTDCKCTEDNHCGCKAKLPPPPPPPKAACGCNNCKCKAHNPHSKCTCDKPCSCVGNIKEI